MRVYRICRAAYISLDGEGARLYGGRWNSVGKPVVYTSSTLSLAALEYLIHVDPSEVPDDLIALTIDVPDDLAVESIDAATLPPSWARTDASSECQAIGDAWLARGTIPILRVPAALVPEETNYLINPLHELARRVTIVAHRPFIFDPRLIDG